MGIGVGFPDSRSGLILRRIPLNSCDMLFVPILPDDFLPVGSEPTLSVCPFFHVPLGIRLTSESGYTCLFWLGLPDQNQDPASQDGLNTGVPGLGRARYVTLGGRCLSPFYKVSVRTWRGGPDIRC